MSACASRHLESIRRILQVRSNLIELAQYRLKLKQQCPAEPDSFDSLDGFAYLVRDRGQPLVIMAVPIAFGDILLLINGTLSLYKRLRDGPAELMVAKRDVNQMKSSLEVLRDALNDRESFLTEESKI